MKGFAASNIAWQPAQDEAAAEILVQHGFTGVEVAPSMLFADPTNASDADLRQQRDRWLGRGLTIVALQSLLYGHPQLRLFADPASRAAMLDHLTRITRVAAGLGAGAMVFGSPGNRQRGDLAPDEAATIATDFFGQLGDIAANHGTTMCLEANAPDYGCDFVCRTREAIELVQAVDSPGFRVQIDTSTMALNGEDYGPTIQAAVPFAAHFHVSEPHLEAVSETGPVPIGEVLAAATAAQYRGWISLEMRAVGVDGNLAALRTAAAAIRAARDEAAGD